MEWHTVPNAALKSNKTKKVEAPESAETNRSFITQTKAVSILCPFLNPNVQITSVNEVLSQQHIPKPYQ